MFPSIRVEGDKEAATRLIPAAMNTLHKARVLAGLSGSSITGLRNTIDNSGAYARVLLIGGQQVVTVYAPPAVLAPVPRLNIGEFYVLSGATRHNPDSSEFVPDIIGVPLTPSGTEYRLRSYRPTQQAWESPLEKLDTLTPTAFSDFKGLSVAQIGTAESEGKSQYRAVWPSMFSGLMCQVVQLIQGYGKLPDEALEFFDDPDVATDGVQVKYDYRWVRCHIITTAADKRLWVVQISQTKGVHAYLLPMLDVDLGSDFDQDVLEFASDTFDGLPSGKVLTDAQITAGVANGTVLQLATQEDLFPFYSSTGAPGPNMGWSTNSKGSEAHNTHFKLDDDAIILSASHYKIAITIGALKTEREENAPIADGSAVLSLVSTGRCPRLSGAFAFANGDTTSAPFVTWTGAQTETTDCPLMAVHINDQLRVIRYDHHPGPRSTDSRTVYDGVLVQKGQGLTQFTTNFPGEVLSSESEGELVVYGATDVYRFVNVNYQHDVTLLTFQDTGRIATGRWPHGVRDGYLILRSGTWSSSELTDFYGGSYTSSDVIAGPGGAPTDPVPQFFPKGNTTYAGDYVSTPPTSYTVLSDGKVIERTWTPGTYTLNPRETFEKERIYPDYEGPPSDPPPEQPDHNPVPHDRYTAHIGLEWTTAGEGKYFVTHSLIGRKHYVDQAYKPGDEVTGFYADGPLINGFGTPQPWLFNFLGYT